jgi:hypothetical protein
MKNKNKILSIFLRTFLGLFFLLVSFVVFSNDVFAVDRYWVGNRSGCDGNWNNTSCWSATDGGFNGVSVPNGTTFDVFFSAHSLAQRDCVINVNVEINTLSLQTDFSNSITFSTEQTLKTVLDLTINSGNLYAGNHNPSDYGIRVGRDLFMAGGKLYGHTADIFVSRHVTYSNNKSQIILSDSISAGDFLVAGSITLADGYLNGGATKNFSINGSFSMTTGSLILSSGNTIISGSFTIGQYTSFDANGGRLDFIGGSNSIISVTHTSNTIVLNDLGVEKSLSSNALLTSFGDIIDVQGTLYLTKGRLAIINNGQILTNFVNWHSDFSGAYISSSYRGYMVIFRPLSLPVGQTDIPSIRVNSSLREAYIETASSATTMRFYGYLDLIGDGGTLLSPRRGAFLNTGNVNLQFDQQVYLNGGNFQAGNGNINFNVNISMVLGPNGTTEPIFNAGGANIVMGGSSTLSISSGDFDASSAVITMNSTGTPYNQSGGVFIAPGSSAGPMTITGSFTRTAGTFDSNGGLLVFTGSINSVFNAGNQSIDYLNINKSNDNSSFLLSHSNTLDVNGTIQFIRGRIGVSNSSVLNSNYYLSYANTFDGAYQSTSYLGYIKIVNNEGQALNIPTANVGLTGKLPSFRIENEEGMRISSTNPVVFYGNLYLPNVLGGGNDFVNYSNVNIAFDRQLILEGGEFNAGNANNILFSGNVSVAGGTLNGQSSNITFNTSSTLNMSSGIFNASGATLLFNSTSTPFNQSGGVFTAPSSTMTIIGSLTSSGGTFNHNSGTIIFSGSAHSTINFGGRTQDIFNLTIDKATNLYRLLTTFSDRVVVNGKLDLVTGLIGVRSSFDLIVLGSIDFRDTFSGAYESTSYLGYITIRTTGSVNIPTPAVGVTRKMPSIRIDNLVDPNLTLNITSTEAVVFYGNFSILNNSGSGGIFQNQSNVNLQFEREVFIEQGSFFTGTGNDVTFIHRINVNGGFWGVGNLANVSFSGFNGVLRINGGEVDFSDANDVLFPTTASLQFEFLSGDFFAPQSMTISRNMTVASLANYYSNSGELILRGSADINFTYQSSNPLHDLILDMSDPVRGINFNSGILIDGNLSLLSGVLRLNSHTHYLAGDFVYPGTNATLVAGTSTFVLNGFDQRFLNDAPLSFYRLEKNLEEVGDTLYFTSGLSSKITISNRTTFQGLDVSQRLNLRSLTGGARWYIDPILGTRIFNFLDVEDSYNDNTSTIMLGGTGSTDSGNNVNYDFGSKFWVGSAINCDGTFADSDCWSASSGGVGGAGVPDSTNIATFDSSDSTDCDINASIDVAGIRINNSYSGTITGNFGTITIGAERFLQVDGEFVLDGADMVNNDNIYIYGGDFVVNSGNFSSKDFYYNYFEPRDANASFSGASSMVVDGHFVFGSNTGSSIGNFIAPTSNLNISGNFYSYVSNLSVFNANGGTVIFNGSNDSIYTYFDSNLVFNDLVLNKDSSSAKLTLNDSIDIGGDLTITRGTLEAPPYSKILYLAGDFSRANLNGVFVENMSEVLLNGTNQTIYNSNNFYKLSKNVSSADTLTFEAGKTTTVSNTLSLSGAVSNLLSLRSTSDGNQWTIISTGLRVVSFLDVKDSENASASAISPLSSEDSGNNINWDFGYKYWVGPNNGTWNDANHWSTTSGGPGGAGVPDINSRVVFDNANNCLIPATFDVDVFSINLTSSYSGELSSVSVGGTANINTTGGLVVAGGIFSVGNNKTLIVGTNLEHTGGQFNGGANNITVGGNLWINGGNFYAGNATTFTVNSVFYLNYGGLIANDAVIDFSDITSLNVNSLMYGTNVVPVSSGSFSAPTSINVALDFYAGGNTNYFHNNGTISLVGSFGSTFSPNGIEFYNVIINKNSPLNSIMLAGDLVVENELTFNTGRLLPSDGVDIYIEGTWNMGSSDFTEFVSWNQSGNATVYFVGDYNVITGSTTFANLTKEAIGPSTLIFDSGGRQTINGTMTLKGASTTERLLIRSNTTMQAEIEPNGPRVIQYLDVENSYNVLDLDPILAMGTGSVDSGGNTHWEFEMMVNSWVDIFINFNRTFFVGAFRGATMIYNLVAPYTTGWDLEQSMGIIGRVVSGMVYSGGVYFGTNQGDLYLRSDVGPSVASFSDVLNGQYSHLLFTVDNGSPAIKLYINGVIDSSYPGYFEVDKLDTNTNPLLLGTSYGSTVGGNNASGEEYFKGKIDEFRISAQAFSADYIETNYNNLNDPSGFISFGAEEQYFDQGGGGTGEMPTVTVKNETGISGEIGAGTLWVAGSGALTEGVVLEGGVVSPVEQRAKWLSNEENDYITFKDSASPDGFRIQLRMVSEDGGNFVYSGSSIGQFNIPVENFMIFGNYDDEFGVGLEPTKSLDGSLATLMIDAGASCSEALNMENYIFHPSLREGQFGLSMSGIGQTYLQSNVPCVVEGRIDIKAMELAIPPSCANGNYSSTLYILIMNGNE